VTDGAGDADGAAEIEAPADGIVVADGVAWELAEGAGPVVFAAPQAASNVASTAAPSNSVSVALVRRIIDYPDQLERRGPSSGSGCNCSASMASGAAACQTELPGRFL
jgi:hypothetical protein